MGLTKNELIGRQYINSMGYPKQVYELTDDEDFERLNAETEVWDIQEPVKAKPVFASSLLGTKMTYSQMWEQKVRDNLTNWNI